MYDSQTHFGSANMESKLHRFWVISSLDKSKMYLKVEHLAHCRNLWIFLPLRFYVKSMKFKIMYRGTEFSNLEIFAIATTYFMLKYAKDQIQRSRFGHGKTWFHVKSWMVVSTRLTRYVPIIISIQNFIENL